MKSLRVLISSLREHGWSTIEAAHAEHCVEVGIHATHLLPSATVQDAVLGLVDHIGDHRVKGHGPCCETLLRCAEDQDDAEAVGVPFRARNNQTSLSDVAAIALLREIPSYLVLRCGSFQIVEKAVAAMTLVIAAVAKEYSGHSHHPHACATFQQGISGCKELLAARRELLRRATVATANFWAYHDARRIFRSGLDEDIPGIEPHQVATPRAGAMRQGRLWKVNRQLPKRV
mmetsp:Transcript_50327/g.109609  ORF Transcript_50327/g.109609 Transcript_50327/m.109609 type:complete len:231 (-) Transcript_50327:121-813(-)